MNGFNLELECVKHGMLRVKCDAFHTAFGKTALSTKAGQTKIASCNFDLKMK